MKPRFITLFLSLCLAAPGWAVTLAPQAHAEIDALHGRLAASQCRFNRNGTWYEAPEARAHLARKLTYRLDKELVGNAEQFIDLAATKSSMSGEPYLVACPGGPAVQSRAWLLAELQTLRAHQPPPKPAGTRAP